MSTKSKLGHRRVHIPASGKEKRQKKNARQEISFYASEAYLVLITSVGEYIVT